MLNTIHNTPCEETMRCLILNNETVDMVITSPPYKDKDGFSYSWMEDVFSKLYHIQKPNSLFFLNFGHLAEDKRRPFKVMELACDAGYQLNETITWVKTQYSPIQGETRLNNLTEFIFLLYKGTMPKLDRLSIGVPYEDKSNIGRYSEVDLHCGGNVWLMKYETITSADQKLHPDRFPVELPRRCIKLSGLRSGIIYDPFAGSGTTAVATIEADLNYLGNEIRTDRYNTAIRRLEESNK